MHTVVYPCKSQAQPRRWFPWELRPAVSRALLARLFSLLICSVRRRGSLVRALAREVLGLVDR
jgi:hypothetical protein